MTMFKTLSKSPHGSVQGNRQIANRQRSKMPGLHSRQPGHFVSTISGNLSGLFRRYAGLSYTVHNPPEAVKKQRKTCFRLTVYALLCAISGTENRR